MFQLKIIWVWLRSSTNFCGMSHSDQVPDRCQSLNFPTGSLGEGVEGGEPRQSHSCVNWEALLAAPP